MGDDLPANPPLPTSAHGKSPGGGSRKAGRPKHLKRRSIHANPSAGSTTTRNAGDSPSRTPQQTNNTYMKEKEMAASFLQYCAMCEKQIMTPCNSILYCSEACRRKDSAKPLSASTITPSSSPGMASASIPIIRSISSSGASSPPPAYYHQYDSHTPSLRIPVDQHDAKSDLDPTEWKPKLQRPSHTRQSEAFRYLSRFHQTMLNNDNINNAWTSTSVPDAALRPSAAPRHKSTMSLSASTITTGTTPSLGNTPTTTSASTSFDSVYNYDYDFKMRPLPPRQNPMTSTSPGTYRGIGIDLVTPHIAPPAPPMKMHVGMNDADARLNVEGAKTSTPNSNSSGLRALFAKEGY
ncbi:hypothetical protein HRR83_006459 [Exophiala dermatitidis]|uniref:Life-span regulatory factor domain-containing protein n=2 Tax=Exophiala dermatitidis TaxID=5970 RepID=H6CAD5_EXODN|nr:uncharacterized protein HMPREF1120_08071 [Exophiala dermatitidis NIH/UT8656]KAJ4503623.1 hypothetical protein HRR75_008017 [Exophiala dermatitidis]EHY60099.1 hypothetical protein HMPREF1120_08071 [Exophiala dermatitidis NIH/UT8656]KAJ4504560.1 hypothetical protein HRR73_008734 [Exophiala dermatitidis]KAJ4505355.1 hypothetical protein HRR74_008726 [Exophiala dermatitidis]KAJ4530659.1 hypothetical protein HRR76_008357 [Exophiala dermatitidis]